MKIIKALLFTTLMFVIAFALVSLPVLFGRVGAVILLAIVFLVIFFAILY